MSKNRKSNKEAKKPKQDHAALKVPQGDPIRATVTTAIMPKGKAKSI
jgi:hypothetical protein